MQKTLLSLSLFAACALAQPVQAQAHTLMPAAELQRGMQGTCRTVFEGAAVEPFQFELIDVMPGALGPRRDLILARLQGEKATYTGVVSGMSGSPCYINDRLIGALSYRFGAFTKEPIAGITPIQDMLALFEIPDAAPQTGPAAAKRAQSLSASTAPASVQALGGELKPITTPLSFSGFDPAVVNHYRPQLTQLGFAPMMASASGSGGHPKAPKQLEMGGAIAGQLVRGDISISGTGTVSYIEGDKVLAFGHPFFNSGHVRLPMATAYIHHILVSEMGSFKMAADGPEVGTITQDRLPAIYGRLNQRTPMIPVQLQLEDQTNVDPAELNFEVFQNPGYTPMMMAMSVHNALQSRLQYNLGGNLSLEGQLKIDGKTLSLQRFYSTTPDSETPVQAAQDLARTLSSLWNNPFQQPQIEQVRLKFTFRPQTRIARIEDVWSEPAEARPGDSVNVYVRLRTYRNDTVLRSLKVQVPSDTPYGPALLLVSNGPRLDSLEDSLKTGYANYAQLLSDLGQRRASDRLYLKWVSEEPGAAVYSEIYPKLPLSILETLDNAANYNTLMPLLRSPGTEYSVATDYDLQGENMVRLMVTPHGKILN